MKLRVKVIPNASRSQVVGWEAGFLKVRVASVAEKGKANRALEHYLAQILDIAPSCVKVVAGETSRKKMVEIEGIFPKKLRSCLIAQGVILESDVEGKKRCHDTI